MTRQPNGPTVGRTQYVRCYPQVHYSAGYPLRDHPAYWRHLLSQIRRVQTFCGEVQRLNLYKRADASSLVSRKAQSASQLRLHAGSSRKRKLQIVVPGVRCFEIISLDNHLIGNLSSQARLVSLKRHTRQNYTLAPNHTYKK